MGRQGQSFIYCPGQQVPWNPSKEMDELYSKDGKVPLIDLEVFAKEHIKEMEETKF